MMRESLLQKDESSSGLYFSLLVVFVIALSVFFAVFTNSLGGAEAVQSKAWYVFLSFSVSPLAILLFTICFSYLKGESVLKVCSAQRADGKYYVLALVAFVSVFFGLGNVNTAFVEFLSKKFGYEATPISLPEFSVGNYLLVILTVCVLPAVAEEIAMRGILLRGIKCGTLLKAVIGGLIFSLYHMTPMQTPYQFAVGFVFCLIAIKSGSVIPTVIAHFLNNFAIVTIEYFCPSLTFGGGGWMLAITLPAVACFFGVIALLFTGDKKEEEKGSLKEFFLYSSFGIAICSIMWLSAFLV